MILTGVVLVGGRSTRMGCDKASLRVDGETLLQRQLRLLAAVGANERLVSLRPDSPRPDLNDPAVQFVADQRPDCGPLAGFEAAFQAAQGERVLMLAVDLPRLSQELLHGLVSAAPAPHGVIPLLQGQLEPHVALYPRSALQLVLRHLARQELRLTAFAEACVREGLALSWTPPAEFHGNFVNWNHPGDWSPTLPAA